MMMTSGTGVHYESVASAFSQIVAREGTRSLFKGAGANIMRGVASAGVLVLYDKFQELFFGKVYSGGAYIGCALGLFTEVCSPTDVMYRIGVSGTGGARRRR